MGAISYLQGFAHLCFPPSCVGCDQPLAAQEKHICTDCWYHMPYTHFHRESDNQSARQLWGQVNLVAVASFLYFNDSSRVQNILHHFKYRNVPEIGLVMGQRYGISLREIPAFAAADLIVPVPLHVRKLRKRGYNQSVFFANGLAISLEKPVLENGLVRRRRTESQTRKSRYERFKNMEELFSVTDPSAMAGKHVLLVDDVLTTGATVEACARALLEVEGVKVSVATLARAQ